MGICGYMWVYVGICGYMWVYVGICGWVDMGVYVCIYATTADVMTISCIVLSNLPDLTYDVDIKENRQIVDSKKNNKKKE